LVHDRMRAPDEPLHASYFTRRLENFSDIVFGFSISLLAVQLGVPKSAAEIVLAHYLFFFSTFAIMAAAWYLHYRMFRFAFAAQALDVILNFIFLAGVAFLPYTLELLTQMRDVGLPGMLYGVDLGTLFLVLAILNLRGLAYWNRRLSPSVQLSLYHAGLRDTCVAIVAYVGAALYYRFGNPGGNVFWILLLLPIFRTKAFGKVPALLLAGKSGSAAATEEER
jgi:uncharacterized membrane protein